MIPNTMLSLALPGCVDMLLQELIKIVVSMDHVYPFSDYITLLLMKAIHQLLAYESTK
jgi:hypothetical protein